MGCGSSVERSDLRIDTTTEVITSPTPQTLSPCGDMVPLRKRGTTLAHDEKSLFEYADLLLKSGAFQDEREKDEWLESDVLEEARSINLVSRRTSSVPSMSPSDDDDSHISPSALRRRRHSSRVSFADEFTPMSPTLAWSVGRGGGTQPTQLPQAVEDDLLLDV